MSTELLPITHASDREHHDTSSLVLRTAPENPLQLLLSTLPHALHRKTPTSYFAAWLSYFVRETGSVPLRLSS